MEYEALLDEDYVSQTLKGARNKEKHFLEDCECELIFFLQIKFMH